MSCYPEASALLGDIETLNHTFSSHHYNSEGERERERERRKLQARQNGCSNNRNIPTINTHLYFTNKCNFPPSPTRAYFTSLSNGHLFSRIVQHKMRAIHYAMRDRKMTTASYRDNINMQLRKFGVEYAYRVNKITALHSPNQNFNTMGWFVIGLS